MRYLPLLAAGAALLAPAAAFAHPHIFAEARLEVVARGEVRRAKLYYLRGRVGKRARVAERRWGIEDELVVTAEESEALDSEGVAQSEAETEAGVEEGEEAVPVLRQGELVSSRLSAVQLPEQVENAVAAGDPSVTHYNDISELPPHMTAEIMSFIEDYTKLENKTVVIEKFFDKATAMEILDNSYKMYHKHYGELHKWFFGGK